MTGLVLPVVAGLLLLLAFLLGLACYSLRDFSRSRLDEICREHGNEERFSVILRQYEAALLAAEFTSLAVRIGIVLFAMKWLGLGEPLAEAGLPWLQRVLAWAALLLVLFFAAAVLPWALSRVAGERYLYRAWPLLRALQFGLSPLVGLGQHIDRVFHRIGGLEGPANGDAAAITDEIRTVVDEGHSEGFLESGARTMIHRVMELQEEDVAAIMAPRTDMVCINVNATLEEARARLLDVGHSRVPVIGESTDDIVGILYAKDLLQHFRGNGDDVRLADIVREPFYVPETTPIDRLLEMMKLKQVHLAVVLDEYGGVAGLVTMEDILEEIVGEIVDEYDRTEAEQIRQIEPGIMEVDARVHIDDLNEQFEFNLPEDDDFDTLGGFVFSHLGRIPESGEAFTWNQLRITVLEADKRKVVKLRIEVDKSLAATASEES